MTRSPGDDLDTAAAVLEFARARTVDADRAEADKLQAAVTWAAMHSVDSLGLPGGGGHGCGTAARPGCRSPAPAPADRGVLGHRVRRRDRPAHRGREGLPR